MWKKINLVITGLEEGITGFLILTSTLVLFVNVVLRYVFKSSTSWAEEAIRYAIIWVTFLGGSVCARKGSHVGIDLFAQVLPPFFKKLVLAFGQFLSAIFSACCAYLGVQGFMLMVQTGQKSPAMMMPMWLVYLSIPLGFGLMAIRFFICTIETMRNDAEKLETGNVVADNGEIDLSRLN